MKIFVHEKGIVMVGKAWEIKHKLLEYQKQFDTLQEWLVNWNERK